MRIGKLFNIPIILHWSLLIGLGYFAFGVMRSGSPFLPDDLDGGQRIVMAVFIASSLFASVLVHELAHSLMAQRLGYVVTDITLMLFGGVSMIGDETRRAVHEFWISVVGPASSLALSVLAFAILTLGPFESPGLARGWLVYMAIANFFLALFNMLPGLPLDGGRIARAAIWKLTGNRVRATRYAAFGGRGIAVLLATGAVALMIWQQSLTGGIWLLLIAGFLWLGATLELRNTRPANEATVGYSVHTAMTPVPAVFPLDMPMSEAMRYGLEAYPYLNLPVIGDGAVVGFVSLSDAKQHRGGYGTTSELLTVGDVYRRCRTGVVRADADVSVAAALLRKGVDRLVVFDNGRLVGTIGPMEVEVFTSQGYEVNS